MDIATATPVEIDTELGRLYTEAFPHRQQIEASRTAVHNLIRGTEGKTELVLTTYANTEARARKLVDELPRSLALLDAARVALAPLEAAEAPLEAEYEARGRWSRFFLVTSSDGGHIHSSMSCATCNNGVYRTQFHWMPEFSGMTMTEAIAEWDKRGSSEILCTVCFPDAPVARTVAQVPDTQCPGSGTWDYPRDTARLGFYSGNFGICRHCTQPITVSSTGKMRKHDKTPAAPKVSAKDITRPDGSPLRNEYGVIKTERTAEIEAVKALADDELYEFTHPSRDKWLAFVEQAIEALAAKRGVSQDEVRKLIETKAAAKIARDKRAAERY